MATKPLDPLKITYFKHWPDGKPLHAETRIITINSVSFWRDDDGVLFLRGWDEEKMTTVDLLASGVRFA